MCDARNSEHKKACHAQQKNNTEGYHIFTESERELVNHTIALPNFHAYLSTVLESFTQCRATTELQAQDIGTDIWR